MQAFDTPELPLHEDEHGVIRVGRTRVALESVVVAFDQGATAEEIVDRYPALSLPVMYSTIAYVLANRARVDAYLSQRQAEVAEVRSEVEKRFPPDGLRARLLSGHEPRAEFSAARRDPAGLHWAGMSQSRESIEPLEAVPFDAAHALEPFKTDAWRKLSPAERLRRSWRLYRRLVDPQAAHDRKLFPAP